MGKTALVLWLLATAVAATVPPEPLIIALPGKEVTFSLKDLKTKLEAITVQIQDPAYKKEKTFDGFRLKDVFALAGLKENVPGDEIVFTAKDGYSPNTSFDSLRNYNAVLVFREHGKKDFEFGKVAQGKTWVSPAPYYLVWQEGEAVAEKTPWPYQLARIEVVNFQKKFEKLYPKSVAADSNVMKGFLTFKNQCLRCHSINLQGGDLGPELNVPMNITEYWEKDTLRRFIRDASSFRYNGKMPAFPDLKDKEIEEVLDYLVFMKGGKFFK